MSISLFFVILTITFLMFFYYGLPSLSKCALPGGGEKKLDFKDGCIAGLIALIYAIAAFTNLGNTESPETSMKFHLGEGAVLELSEPCRVEEFVFFSGVNIGSYSLEVSPDGENYEYAGTFDQNYVAVLKWNFVACESMREDVKFIRMIATSGSPELCEFSVRASNGAHFSKSVLTDEQGLIPEKSDFHNSSYFDEIYHARTAVEYMRGERAYEITHPPLGKLIIALGIRLFGLTPFGWRFSGTFFGVLMLPVMYVFVKKLFGGRMVPAAVEAVFAFDFMHFVQTRIATIDTYSVFFILLMYLFMYMFVSGEGKRPLLMLFLSGLFFGLGAASKWTCLYAGAGLGVIWAVYWMIKGKKLGFKAFLENSLYCVLFFVIIPAAIYYLSYYPYGKAEGLSGLSMFFTSRYRDIVLDNQLYMFNYHSGVDATHPYSSTWYQWVFDIRPILYYLEYDGGRRSSFGAFVNPVLCWGGMFSLFVLAYMAVFRRDKKAAFILGGYLAQLLPWVLVTRIVFEYHYFPCTVFLCMSVGYCFELLRVGDKHHKIRIFGFAVAAGLAFILFYPALSGAWVDNSTATKLMHWLPTWPF